MKHKTMEIIITYFNLKVNQNNFAIRNGILFIITYFNLKVNQNESSSRPMVSSYYNIF